MPHIRNVNPNFVSESVGYKRNPPSVRRLDHVQLLHLDPPAEVEGAGAPHGHLASDVPRPGPDQGLGLLRAVGAGDDGGAVEGAAQHRLWRIINTNNIERRVGGKWQPKRFDGGKCHKTYQ